MVVFTCNHCGETLHKPKVDKHYQFKCRNYKSITCVDCLKDFRDEEYVSHTKCITEDERYAAKGTFKNGIVKKGEVKQDSWLETIRSICEQEQGLKPPIRRLLETISEYSNVPRKKQKFLNFIRSSSGNRVNMQEIEEVWVIIEKYKNKPVKRPLQDDSPAVVAEKQQKLEATSEKFDFTSKIIEILTKKGGKLSMTKLQKKILKSYTNQTGQETDEKTLKKFNKKLKKVAEIVNDDVVMLIDNKET